MAATTVCGGWAVMPPSSPHEFELVAHGATYRAYRHRGLGGCWWEVTRDHARAFTGGDLTECARRAHGGW